MFGIDLSNHQKGIRLGKFSFDFAIIKATEGVTFKDPSFDAHVSQVLGLDKCIGAYHYLRPDNQKTTKAMEREARNFIGSVSGAGLIGRALLFADWEQQPMERVDLLIAFCDYVEKETGIKPFIYSSNSWFRSSVDWNKASIDNPLWVASWPTISEMNTWPTKEWLNGHSPSTRNKIWQFTSKGRVPDYRGFVDLDYTEMNAAEWKQLACGKPIENISGDMQWAIDRGIFYGYPDGTYRPNEMLTRWQAASLLRRFYSYIISNRKSEEK